MLEHQSIGGDSRVHGLELVNKSVVDDPVACPLPAGGFNIHRNRTAHYTGPNSTDAPRRALIMGANLTPRPYAGKRRFLWNDAEAVPREEKSQRPASGTR